MNKKKRTDVAVIKYKQEKLKKQQIYTSQQRTVPAATSRPMLQVYSPKPLPRLQNCYVRRRRVLSFGRRRVLLPFVSGFRNCFSLDLEVYPDLQAPVLPEFFCVQFSLHRSDLVKVGEISSRVSAGGSFPPVGQSLASPPSSQTRIL